MLALNMYVYLYSYTQAHKGYKNILTLFFTINRIYI